MRTVSSGFRILHLALASLIWLGLISSAVPAEYRVDTLVDGLEHPWALAVLPDGSVLITERPGRLRYVSPQGHLQDKPLPGLPDDIFVESQAGLMDIALANDFAQSRQIFLSYACGTAEANTTCLASAHLRNGELQDLKEIFRAQPELPGAVHYGGRLAVLPDSTVLLTVGDRFSYRDEAQNRGNHLGKIIRLHADGSVPADNPFVNRADTADEIYTLGHRNPQGLVYDGAADRIISHEHGARGGDELNMIWAGANYGWPLVTASIDYTGAMITPFRELPGMVSPLLIWPDTIAPSGLAHYEGDAFPEWQGDYFVGGLVGQSLRRVSVRGYMAREETILLEELGERIRDVRTGPDGFLYVLTDSPDASLRVLSP